jgi:parallel beta-helix repeat protein
VRYKVDGNHNDLCQNWGGSFNVFRGNTFITNENPNQPFLDKPGISDVQCLAKFDQNSTNILVENNLVLGSHPIGIWWLGTSYSIIRYNTVVQVGDKTWFSNRPPTIATWPSKSGSSGKNNQIYGNLCQTIECQDGVAVKDYNLLIKTGDFSKTFKNWRSHDLHLVKPIYSTAKGEPPKVDKDGKVRNQEKPCVGCYEF